MVRLRENMEFDEEFAEEQDKEWKSIVWWRNKCAAVKARDTHERLNEEFLDKTVTQLERNFNIKFSRRTEGKVSYIIRKLNNRN